MHPLTPGKVFTLRRSGENPYQGNASLFINQIKLYETVNLLEEAAVKITADTSKSLDGYEAINLLRNFRNRSCGGQVQSGIVTPL